MTRLVMSLTIKTFSPHTQSIFPTSFFQKTLKFPLKIPPKEYQNYGKGNQSHFSSLAGNLIRSVPEKGAAADGMTVFCLKYRVNGLGLAFSPKHNSRMRNLNANHGTNRWTCFWYGNQERGASFRFFNERRYGKVIKTS